MPWCPVCKNEYKDGYKVCSDCGAPLVENFEDIEKVKEDTHNHDNIKDLVSFEEGESLRDMDTQNAYADIVENDVDIFADEETKNQRKVYKPYMKASDRAEEYKSSAFALLLVGCIGIVFLFLCLLGIIPLHFSASVSSVGFIAMLVIFVAFIVVGVKSYVESKTINALSDAEDALSDSITDYFKENYDIAKLDKEALSEHELLLSNEEKYFKREETIRNIITVRFGCLDESFLDNETERIFNMIFGS